MSTPLAPEDFAWRWHALVGAWTDLRSTDPDEAARLLRKALSDGVAALQLERTFDEPDVAAEVDCAMELVAASGRFDASGYRDNGADLARLRAGRISPLKHFCTSGWAWLRSPSADFDPWWYWNEYLDPTSTAINPFIHYLLSGAQAGVATKPSTLERRPDAPRSTAATRRICLFAAYDVDGIVDEYVIDYLTELSKYADIYYLADGVMSADELAKLDGITKAAWAIRHGCYDFGSFAMLASELVGWDRIDEYDELLIANDSCFLLRPLTDVFAKMADTPADWWGLQATKRDWDPRYISEAAPIPLSEGKALRTDLEDWSPYFRIHLSSYFLVFRKRVMDDPGFRRRLSNVARQDHKALVIFKYEIGLSDYLIKQGFDFATYIEDLYPFHPLYNSDYFSLVGLGFPLLKRNFLGENTRNAPDLHLWKERILEHTPDAPVEMFERNLTRVTPDDALQRSFAIRTRADGSIDLHEPLSSSRFRVEDLRTPKHDHWWAFPVCAYDHSFAGNERAIFEEVRDDPSIKKIILTRSRRVDVTGQNLVIVPITSREGQHYLLRSGQIFVKHGPMINVPWPLAPMLHNFVNTWHGIPLKRFGFAAAELSDRARRVVMRNDGASRSVLTSSRMDALAMASAMYPVPYADMWPTGLPRNDFITRAEEALPADLRASLDRLRCEAAGRRVVMFLPTFKDGQWDAYYQFTPEQVAQLRAWLEANNAVLAVREHMADAARTYSSMLAPLDPIDLSSRRYPHLEVLYRAADVLISDYSSCLVDFLMTGKPVISFAYDYEAYARQERGLFYDLEKVLPGPVCRTFPELLEGLDRSFDERSESEREVYEWKRRIFFDHLDDQASARVVARVKEWYGERRRA